jgi:hypothetical protein
VRAERIRLTLTGERIVLVDRESLSRHRRWIGMVVAALVVTAGWYFAAAFAAGELPGGGSLPGFTFGVAGGGIIIFEFLLWPRKRYRKWRVGSAQAWLRAHIWLGLFVLPLLILHSGFRFGGTLSTVLLLLLVVVVVSGVVGLVLQQFVPGRLLEEVPGETVPTQLERVMTQLYKEADALARVACGMPAEAADEKEAAEPILSYLPADVSRGRTVAKAAPAKPAAGPAYDMDALHRFHEMTLVPFLRDRRGRRSPLRSASQAAVLFDDLRNSVPPSVRGTVDTIEDLCERRRQLEQQQRLHFWLHSWLFIHLPLSGALLVLMFVHAVFALMYW